MRWRQRTGETAWEIGSAEVPGDISDMRSGSFVAAEIHLGRRSAGFSDQSTALQHSSCVPAEARQNMEILQSVPRMISKL
jgi:hypothetical protein